MNERYEAENRKYHGPAVRIVPLTTEGRFAVVDHHYQIFAICTEADLLFTIKACLLAAPAKVPPHLRGPVARNVETPNLGDVEL